MDLLSPALTVPVIAIVYNRPRYARNLVSVLRNVRPAHLLIVADGPKLDGGRDERLVDETRHELETIDWPCRIDRNYSSVNLGCDSRIRSGLDWAFDMVDEAIVLEDDIDAVPQFFDWAQRVLDVYRDRDDIAMICGNNQLIRWPEGRRGTSAILSRRGGWHGWATYARAWRAVRHFNLRDSTRTGDDDVTPSESELRLGALNRRYLADLRRLPEDSWPVDIEFALKMVLSGRLSVYSTVNYIHHLGVEADATHESGTDDTFFRLPRPEIPPQDISDALPTDAIDERFDRAKDVIQLLMRATNPEMARRLSKHQNLPIDPDLRLHLTPFVQAQETAAILDHLRREGLDQEKYRYWYSAVAEIPHHGDTP